MASLYNPNPLGTLAAPVKRKAYFAFHFDDVMRVNNVRNAWKITHPDSSLMRSFQDSSLWESKKLQGDDALKNLIRAGVQYTSAVCVLVGTDTWSRRWVKFEIARSVIDERGLLAVHINSLNHHQRQAPDTSGFNPLKILGVFHSSNGQFYIYEKRYVTNLSGQGEWQWLSYSDYTQSVSLPKYLRKPDVGYVMPLSSGTIEYDYCAHDGHKNIGSWIDAAAQAVGR
jgi:hypothetical protein